MEHLKICPPPLGAHKDCKLCEEHYLTEGSQRKLMPQGVPTLNDEHAQLSLHATLQGINKSLDHVRAILCSHGDVILSRWNKFSQEKRANLLTTAAPHLFDLPLMNEPNVWGTKRAVDPLIPWLDAVSFSQDRAKLLSLLHVRSEYDSSQWAAFDTRSARRACTQSGWLAYTHNPRAVILHGPQYGKLVKFDVHAAHSWQQAGYPRAKLTFAVQQEISNMLSAVVDLLKTGAGSSGNTKWTAMVSGGLQSGHEKAQWSSYYNQEFAPPRSSTPTCFWRKPATT
jgi:hypothetical protein